MLIILILWFLDILIILVLLCSLYQSHRGPPNCRKHLNNPQLGGLFLELGMEEAFPGRAEHHFVILSICERAEKIFELFLLVKCRSVSMWYSYIYHSTTIEKCTSPACCLASQRDCTGWQRRFYVIRARNQESPRQYNTLLTYPSIWDTVPQFK